jgi:hypothetical protein
VKALTDTVYEVPGLSPGIWYAVDGILRFTSLHTSEPPSVKRQQTWYLNITPLGCNGSDHLGDIVEKVAVDDFIMGGPGAEEEKMITSKQTITMGRNNYILYKVYLIQLKKCFVMQLKMGLMV